MKLIKEELVSESITTRIISKEAKIDFLEIKESKQL